MNYNELRAAKQRERDDGLREVQVILDRAEREGRTNVTKAEEHRLSELAIRHERAQGAIEMIDRAESEDQAADAAMRTTFPTSAKRNMPNKTASVRVGSEPRTYRSPSETRRNYDGTPAEPTFLNDLYRAQILNDSMAHQRLARHGQEMITERPELEMRAVSTGGVPGFIPPEYMAELFAKYARAGRPTANLFTHMPLPAEGMTTNIPRLTTPTATGVQATENATLANNDPASTLLTSPVVTVGGYVVLSRQSVERGMLTEEVVTADLRADYNTRLDVELLTGSGTGGHHLGLLNISGINAVTYTAATPTLGGLFPKLASAVGQVMSNRYAGPTGIVMSPTEWVWMLAQVDSNGRPLIQAAEGSYNPLGSSGTPGYGGQAGTLFNLPVYLDGNVPANLGAGTNETRIIVADFEDSYLFEDANGAPVNMRFEAPNAQSLGILLVAYGYSAAALGRQPKSISVVSGTGLITPAL